MKKQPAILYLVISALVLVIVGLIFVVVQQNSNRTENSGTTLPQTQGTESPITQQSDETPVGDVNQEILTPPEVETEEERIPQITFEGNTRVLSGLVKSKTQTQIVITEDISGQDYTIETADTSSIQTGNYLTAECTNIQENVCQASEVQVKTTEEIN